MNIPKYLHTEDVVWLSLKRSLKGPGTWHRIGVNASEVSTTTKADVQRNLCGKIVVIIRKRPDGRLIVSAAPIVG